MDGPEEAVGAWGRHERALSQAVGAVILETSRQAAALHCEMVTGIMGGGLHSHPEQAGLAGVYALLRPQQEGGFSPGCLLGRPGSQDA